MFGILTVAPLLIFAALGWYWVCALYGAGLLLFLFELRSRERL